MDEHIIDAVLDKINEAQIWIPSGEIVGYYHRKKPHLKKRPENEKNITFKSYVSFYKSIVAQDRCAVVICNLNHEIIYMNLAAVLNDEKWGGEKLIGRSLMECHNQASREKIQQVVDWFIADEDKLEKVLENPQVIKTPVVRNGKESTLGYQPDVWKGWN